MNFRRIFDHKKSDAPTKNMEEIYKIKEAIEKEDKIFENELPAKYTLLQQFSIDELKKLCNELIGREPPIEEYSGSTDGGKKTLPLYKEDYIHFVTDELRLSYIKKLCTKEQDCGKRIFQRYSLMISSMRNH